MWNIYKAREQRADYWKDTVLENSGIETSATSGRKGSESSECYNCIRFGEELWFVEGPGWDLI